jgi:hypothetical protein
MSLACGVILEAVSASRREFKRMRYLDLPAPDADRARPHESTGAELQHGDRRSG